MSVKDHCVIGLESPNGIGRTWVSSEAEAVAHAEFLLALDAKKNGQKRLFVVKVVAVVELTPPTPPPTRVRAIIESDTAKRPFTD